jgi:seryl-tRNA synthetase
MGIFSDELITEIRNLEKQVTDLQHEHNELHRQLEIEKADNRNCIDYGIQLRKENAELLEALKAAAINPNQQIVSETILKYTK